MSGDAIENLIESANDADFEFVNKGGFFNVTDPSVGFTIHAGAVSALRDRLAETGVTTGREIDDMEATLEEAASRDSGWVSTPFMLDLALRRTEAPVVL